MYVCVYVCVSVGVLEDKSSCSRILEDNFEVIVLDLESRVLGLEAFDLDSITGVCVCIRMQYVLLKGSVGLVLH